MKKIFLTLLFYLHTGIFLLFPLGFLIPSSIWPERITYHFYYTISLFVLFYLWGLVWTLSRRDKVYAVCLLDTIAQRLRGLPLSDPRNYEHSFVKELSNRLGIQLSKRLVLRLSLGCVMMTAVLYLLKQVGIVLY